MRGDVKTMRDRLLVAPLLLHLVRSHGRGLCQQAKKSPLVT